MSKLLLGLFMFFGIFFLGQKCTPSSHETAEHHGVLDEIKHANHAIVYKANNSEELDSAFLLKVHSTVPEVADFLTERRVQNIRSFPCANCHNQSLEQMQAKRSAVIKKAHWDINLVHTNADIMNCMTCHSKNNMNQLVSLTKQPIHIDQSFKLCGQCHATQLKDWQGGAHGKQLNGWKPPRVAKTCVSCHNPHQPGFPSRFPARLNTYNAKK